MPGLIGIVRREAPGKRCQDTVNQQI
jgi:hypothetical protein